jgi:dipeptidase D
VSKEGAVVVSNAIQGLKPEPVWRYFAEISAIPRCSKHEEAMTAYVLGVAKKLGLEAKADASGNVVVRKPASPGKEGVRSVCLQGHLDMVCEKNKETVHDFSRDPIRLVRKGDWLSADGTTLGADNGIAVATNLAIMEDRTLVHGPLEFLFTVDEETGLTGASALDGSLLRSRTLMNLDSEEEGALYVGCSGGRDSTAVWKIDLEKAPGQFVPVTVKVGGLRGGHSGLEIDKGRGNAIKLLVRLLLRLTEEGARLSSMEGGNKHNAIPREAEAVLAAPKKKLDALAEIVAAFEAAARAELSTVDPDLRISMSAGSGKTRVMGKGLQRRILRTLSGLPHGVMKMSADIPGLVETSTNVAVLRTTKKAVELVTSQRSSVASEIAEIVETVEHIMLLGGAAVSHGDGYPGWKPDMASPILKTAKDTYRALTGKDPAVKAIHAGLECGIIGERCPGMDMVSFGPTLEGVHSPDERIHIGSVERYWEFLLATLRAVN